MAEAIARISDQVFAAVDTRPVYVHDGAQRLQRFIRQFTAQRTFVTPTVSVARRPRRRPGRRMGAIRDSGATARSPRSSVIICCCRSVIRACSIVIIGALVTLKHGPFVLRREYRVRQAVRCRSCSGGDHH